MTKYAIKHTKDDTTTILEIFESKDAAINAGTEYRKQYTREQGLISCISADFDENNNMVGNSYRLLESWC